MAVEIEAKMKVADLEVVKRKLESLGAEHLGEIFEINTFFDTDDRSLLAADQGLRLRVNRNIADGTENYVYTFKGPRMGGQLKSREELELGVTSSRDAERFLLALGYKKILSFEKKRHKWKLGGCSVELDELPHLGVYVEIEGPNEDAIMKVREAIGLSKAAIIKSSYIAMLMAHLQEQGSHNRAVVFSK